MGTRSNFYNTHLQYVNFVAETKKIYQTDLIFFFVAATNFSIKKLLRNKKSTHGDTHELNMQLQQFFTFVAIA